MPTLLALDTSATRCTVALTAAGQFSIRSVEDGRQNAQRVLPLIADVLTETGISLQQLDAIAVLAGPGSFTGIRIGIGVAQGLGMANGTPVLAVSNLALKAFTAMRQTGQSRVLVIDGARDKEVYFGAYQRCPETGVKLLGTEQVCTADEILLTAEYANAPEPWVAAGNGWRELGALPQRLGVRLASGSIDPAVDGRDFCALASLRLLRGEAVPAAQALPNYVKDTLSYSTPQHAGDHSPNQ